MATKDTKSKSEKVVTTTKVTTRRKPVAPRQQTKVAPKATTKVVAPKATDNKVAPKGNNGVALAIVGLLAILACIAMYMFLAPKAWTAATLIVAPRAAATQPAAAPAVTTPTATAASATQAIVFPLMGLRFPAYVGSSPHTSYDLFVEADGRFWQKWLPTANQRVAHSVSFELPAGSYTFNGVLCRLYVDASRNRKGTQNPLTVAEGNDLRFTVSLPAGSDYQTAYALVECDGGNPSGFEIWWLGK